MSEFGNVHMWMTFAIYIHHGLPGPVAYTQRVNTLASFFCRERIPNIAEFNHLSIEARQAFWEMRLQDCLAQLPDWVSQEHYWVAYSYPGLLAMIEQIAGIGIPLDDASMSKSDRFRYWGPAVARAIHLVKPTPV